MKKGPFFFFLFFLVVAFAFSLQGIYEKEPEKQQSSEIDTIMDREDFKRRMENQAEQIYLNEEIVRVKSEYDTKLNELETRLEAVRQEELSL